jgi:5-methyltetrahydrofolate--homocysteine methyltransferase
VKDVTPSEVRRIVTACAQADGLLLETFSDPEQAKVFAKEYRSISAKPVLVSFTFDGQTQKTFRNVSSELCAGAAADMGAAALGVNCGRDVDMTLCAATLRRYRTVTTLPLFARINAGTPSNGIYPKSAEEMAEELLQVLEAGAIMVGGCCGTTPRHIEAFAVVIDSWNRRSVNPRPPEH